MASKKKAPVNPTLKYSTLEVDGETYSLAFSFNSIAVAEREAGSNLLLGLRSLESLNAAQLRGLLFAAMSPAQPDITLDQAGALVRLDTLPAIELALAQAYLHSMPERKQQDPTVPVEPAATK